MSNGSMRARDAIEQSLQTPNVTTGLVVAIGFELLLDIRDLLFAIGQRLGMETMKRSPGGVIIQ